jgi:hypothetical protein
VRWWIPLVVGVLAASCGDAADSTADDVAVSDGPDATADGVVDVDPPPSTTESAETTTSTTVTPTTTVTPSTTTATTADAAANEPSFGQIDAALLPDLLQSGYDGPFFMINLIEFRDQAVYADGRETDLTGEEANNIYGQTGVEVLIEGGMRPALQGRVVTDPAAPATPAWDQVAIARYPSYQEFLAMTRNPAFQEGVEHKDAGVAATTVMPSLRIGDAPVGTELPAADAPVALFELFSHDGNGATDRPAPLADYLDGLAAAATAAGGIALGSYDVQGTMIGDGREWDEAHLWWFADPVDLDALLTDPELGNLTAARDGALTDHYRLVLDGVQVEPIGREP